MQIPVFPVLVLALAACAEQRPSAASSADSVSHQVQASTIARADTDTVALRVTRDSLRLAAESATVRADSARRDSSRNDSALAGGRKKPPVDTFRWPTNLPAPLPGSLFPSHRIVAFYGNPLSKRMGILGELPPDQMLAKLERTAKEWAAADSTTTVTPALHLIVTVA